MYRTIARDLRNKGRKEGEWPNDKPILLKSYEVDAEDNNHAENEEIPRILQEDLERIKPSKSQSNHRLLWLAIITCLILIAALLVYLLILSRKLGHGCGCSEESGPQSLKCQLPRGISSKDNKTNISDLIEKFDNDLKNKKAAVDGMKSDLAKLNRTITGIENLKYQLIDVKAAVNGTKKGLAELNSTVETVQYINSYFNKSRAAVNGTKNDLAEFKRTVTSERDKPSAHIGSIPLRVKTYQANTVLKDWSNSTPYSHLTGGMSYYDGNLTVPIPGRYYIYFQIYYQALGRVYVRVNGKWITMVQPGRSGSYNATSNAAGLFELKAGDDISLYAADNITVYLENRFTYFGAFLI